MGSLIRGVKNEVREVLKEFCGSSLKSVPFDVGIPAQMLFNRLLLTVLMADLESSTILKVRTTIPAMSTMKNDPPTDTTLTF